MTVTMADGINSDAAAILAHFGPSMPVACYVNGEFAWTPAQEHSFARKIRISVEPGQPEAAKFARCLDVERFDARPADVLSFLLARERAGHQDATIYCNLSTVADVIAAAGEMTVPRWWLAWYWGRRVPPSAGQVLDELGRLAGANVQVVEERLWACQWAGPLSGGPWDLSVVYGPYDWSR